MIRWLWNRRWTCLLVLLFCAFWALRGWLHEPVADNPSDPVSIETPPVVDELEPEAEVGVRDIQLAQVTGSVSTRSASALLKSLYGYGGSDELCWEEVTSDRYTDVIQVPLGFSDPSQAPEELVELFAGKRVTYIEFQHQWVSKFRALLFHQNIVVTSEGRSVPAAFAVDVRRFQEKDGEEFWEVVESASLYPCSLYE